METIDESRYIIIGKYCISKVVRMSEPAQLYVINMENNERKLYYIYHLLNLLREEKLDAEPLHDYIYEMTLFTKEQRNEINRKYDEWVKRNEERRQMKKEDKI